MISWRSKKENTIARFSAEAKYMPWKQLKVKLHGYDNFSSSSNLETPRALSLFVIIKELFTLHPIQFSMNGLNT